MVAWRSLRRWDPWWRKMAQDAYKIFVGGLPAHTTSESMHLHFSQFGHCDAVVMMDRSTGRSRGFGFCTFGTMESLDAALAVPQVIDGKVADVKPCLPKEQAPPGLQPREFGNGKGLSKGQSERAPLLEQHGADAGAFVGQTQMTFESQVAELEAQAAMFAEETAAPGEIYGEEMFEQQEGELAPWPHEVESMPASMGQGSASQFTQAPQPNKLFVGGLSQLTTKDSLEAYFSQFGVCDVIVMMDKNTGRSRGFGFCTFQEPEAAQAAVDEPLQHIVDGKPVECKFAALPNTGGMVATQASHAPQGLGGSVMGSVGAYGKGGRPAVQHAQPAAHPTANADLSSNRVFIGGLPQSCDDAKLEAIFANFGQVIDAKVMMDRETQRSRGFGYISYTSAESADAAISVSGQIAVDGKVVEVKYCQARHNGVGGAAPSGHSGMMTGATPMRQSPASQQDLATQAIQLTQLLIDPALGLQDLIGPLLEQLQTAADAIKSGANPTAAAAALKGFGVNPGASASAARGFRQGPPRWAPY